MPLLKAPPPGHRILLVEDHDPTREVALEALTASGYRVRGVASVDEAFQAMQEEDFCLYIVDQELPARRDGLATVDGGRRIIVAIRQADSRRVDLAYLTSIVVWTGFSIAPDFVWSMKDLGADGFVDKGMGGMDRLLAEVHKRLVLAGRADHADCAAFEAERASAGARPEKMDRGEPAAPISIYVVGKEGTRTTVEINGEPRGMQDGKLVVLLRLIDKWERGGHLWSEREELGIKDSRETISRVRAVFRGLAPIGFDPIQADRSGRFRLHPEVEVRFVPWDELEDHPHGGVRKLALRHNAWRAEENRREARTRGVTT
jgi:CheY-like chemotaxis protein